VPCDLEPPPAGSSPKSLSVKAAVRAELAELNLTLGNGQQVSSYTPAQVSALHKLTKELLTAKHHRAKETSSAEEVRRASKALDRDGHPNVVNMLAKAVLVNDQVSSACVRCVLFC